MMDSFRFLLLIGISTILFCSCNKDEPDTTFEGTWVLQATESRNCNDPKDNEAKNSRFVFNEPCGAENLSGFLCRHNKYVFTSTAFTNHSTSTLITIPVSLKTSGSYTLNGNRLSLCVEEGPVEKKCDEVTMDIDGNTLIITKIDLGTGCTEIDYFLKR